VRFGPQVERWRTLASQEARGIPVDLVLGIIWHESGGKPGAIGRRKTKCSVIPSASGPRRACNALGLMQVVPRNVTSWNAKHTDQVATWELLTGHSTRSARMQIRIGAYILKNSLAWLSRYGFPWPAPEPGEDHVRIGLMVYAWGPGHMKPHLDQLRSEGRPITAAQIAARWPDLGKPANQPLRYSRRVWKKTHGDAGDVGEPTKKTKPDSLGWGILAIAALVAFASRR